MDTFRRIWDFLTSVGAFFFLPAICAVFSGLIVYILPDWAVLRYPLMVVLIVLSGLMSWKASEIGLQDMLQKGHIDGVKPWMRYFCYLIGVAGVACTAYVMYAFAMSEKKKNAPRPATVYVVRGDEFSRVRVEVTDTAYTVSDADRVLSFMPESDSCYVANLTADTLVVYREFYGRAKVKDPLVLVVAPVTYAGTPALDDLGHSSALSDKTVRLVLTRLSDAPDHVANSVRKAREVK